MLAILFAGCAEKETLVEVSSVSLNTATIEMVEGETFSLVATVLPKDAEYDGVTWASSNASVAGVNPSGVVTALKEGTATITASAGGKSSTCGVRVSAKVIAVTSVTLDNSSLSLQVGETATLTATVKPDNASNKSVEWNSSDVSVATVSDGKVTARKSGTATITAKSGNCTAECDVSVTVNTESVTLDKTALSLAVGETAQLTATVSPADATDKTVAWSSSDASVAKVDNGKVTALKSGKATITAKCGEKTAECVVTVSVPVTSISLDKTALSLAVGETAQLTATVSPADATDKTVAWSSSDASVAKVDNGKVTALKSGKATITAKCGEKTAECVVTVSVPVTSISLDKTALSLAVGETAQLTATVSPADATDKTVAWSSSDASVAKVDNGKVTALKSGKATITAKCGEKTAECVVTVSVPVTSISLDKTALSLAVGETAQLTATVSPADATDKTVAWSSSDASVARVNNGKVTAVSTGTAIITAISAGFSASCNVSVTHPDNVIYYTSSDGNIVQPYDNDTFGANIVSNEYVEGIGRIVFDGPVTKIGGLAFNDCKNLQSVNIPDKVTKIGGRAFYNTGISTINLPSELSRIEPYTFSSSSLKSIIIPQGVKSIGEYAFSYCESLVDLVLPEGLESIERYAFTRIKVANVVLPESLSSLGEGAFKDSKISTINIPGGLSEINSDVFAFTTIEAITIPGNVQFIGRGAFRYCDRLKSVIISQGVKIIGHGAFSQCKSLVDLVLPEGLENIASSAFTSTAIDKFSIPQSVISIGDGAFGGTNIVHLEMPAISYGEHVFSGCKKLLSVVVLEGVDRIPTDCFFNCTNLQSVTLPSTIKVISAFLRCEKISKLYVKATVPPYLSGIDSLVDLRIYVPRSSVDAYKAHEYWSKYKDSIVGYDF